MSSARRNGLAFAIAAALPGLALGCLAGEASRRATAETSVAGQPADVTAAQRIAFYSQRLREHPRLYSAHTQLGIALLDHTRETHDPSLLARARREEGEALAIQPNFESLMAMTAIQNFSHRFEDAIRWGRRAAAASVGGSTAVDPAVVAALVEAYLGFGRPDEAAKLLPDTVGATNDFHTAAALGHLLAERRRATEASQAFARASRLALSEGAADLAAWAETAAAGVLLDDARPDEALAHLDEAARLAPPTAFLRMHRAELAIAAGDAPAALASLEELLAVDPDPVLEALACRAARKSGDAEAAGRHFRAAERGFRRAIAANEVYTLGALARLYLDAGRNLPAARELARENLRWKRDRSARETLAAIEARIHGARGGR